MRNMVKQQLLELLKTVGEGTAFLLVGGGDPTLVKEISEGTRQGLLSVHQRLLAEGETALSAAVEAVLSAFLGGGVNQALCKQVERVQRRVEKEARVRLEIVFLPYKYAMFDCMESVWQAAMADESCNVHLLPIPYYTADRENDRLIEHYEGESFSSPIEDYRTYLLEVEQPDVIYFHNPYDDCNTVTSVNPRFFSSHLRECCSLLCYLPYYLAGAATAYERIGVYCNVLGVHNADLVVLQSKELVEAYVANGIPREKLVALGSPKIDAVLQPQVGAERILGGKKIPEGAKVLLVNTSISSVLANPARWIPIFSKLLLTLLENPKIFPIWRPHPLLRESLAALKPQALKDWDGLVAVVAEAPFAVLDESDSALSAIALSDALITDYSSLMPQYVFTGKPVMQITLVPDNGTHRVWFCDYSQSYFSADDGMDEQFIPMLLAGEDPKAAVRLRCARRSVENPDGSCGKKVHQFVTRQF